MPNATDTELKTRIWAIDLEPVLFKLLHDDKRGEYTLPALLDGAEEYRRFLYLAVTRKKPTVPTRLVDVIWHQHILDTAKYADDCTAAFGYFLHHFPYYGMRGSEDKANLEQSFAESEADYALAFGTRASASKDYGWCQPNDCGPVYCGDCGTENCSPVDDIHQAAYAVMRSKERPRLAALHH